MQILIIGATGTMGRLLVEAFSENHLVTAVSRDEQKIGSMPKYESVKYAICDIRNRDQLFRVMSKVKYDCVINLAALKCVDIVEANPMAAVETNVLGSQNLIDVAEQCGRPKIIFTSTDKAVYPINAYGQSKALAEALYKQYSGACTVFRYGNILGSRGSVLPLFVRQILNREKVNITSVYMTRFWVLAETVRDQIIAETRDTRRENKLKLIFSKAMSICHVAEAISRILGKSYETEIVGLRPGEKLHESLAKSTDRYEHVGERAIPKQDISSNTFAKYTMMEMESLLTPLVEKIKAKL